MVHLTFKISHIACFSLSRKIRFLKSSDFLKTNVKLRTRSIIIIPFFSYWNGENNTLREHREIKYPPPIPYVPISCYVTESLIKFERLRNIRFGLCQIFLLWGLEIVVSIMFSPEKKNNLFGTCIYKPDMQIVCIGSTILGISERFKSNDDRVILLDP